jgi:7-carboxy-7-deazaguanine synthase
VTSAPVAEIFSSLAGEGPHVGRRHLFLRLAGCDVNCDYCDTPTDPAAPAEIERAPGEVVRLPNPLSVEAVLGEVLGLEERAPGHAHLAVTGGEPLLYAGFLQELLPLVRETGPAVYLETAGVHPDALPPLLPLLDVVATDVKLPHHCGRAYWEESECFLEICAQAPVELLVKIVFGRRTPWGEVEEALRLVAETAPGTEVTLQPIHGADGRPELTGDQMLRAHERASAVHPNLRVLPQVHKLIELK